MPAFEYKVVDENGRPERGVIEADSERLARQLLRERGWMPVKVQRSANRVSRWKRAVSGRSLELFVRQLAALVRSGVPLDEALRACSGQTDARPMKSLIMVLRSRVLEGRSLSAAMTEQRESLPALFPALVAAGEQSGTLGAVLLQLAAYCERVRKLRGQVLQACVYPAVLLVVSILVVAVLMTSVVPRMVEQFQQTDQALPWLTEALIMTSAAIQSYGIQALLVLLLSLGAMKYLLRSPGNQLWWHRQLLRLPLVGSVLTSLDVSRLFSTLSVSVSAGVSMVDALSVAKETVVNRALRQQVVEAMEQVREGGTLSHALAAGGRFPAMPVFMLANGEVSGDLSSALQHAAQQLEDELSQRIAVTTALLEPAMIILFGGVVLMIVLAIMLPIMQLNTLTQF